MPAHPPPASPGTPTALFADCFAADPARPLLVWYDDAASARIELSVATMANWVAKTGNLLQDTIGVSGGDRLALALPPHWFAPVWMLAGWCAGLVIDLDTLQGADVAVVGPDTLDSGLASGADELVACGTAPLGGPFPGSLPDTVLDYGTEVSGQDDRFQPFDPPSSTDPALIADGRTLTGAELVNATRERADELGLAAAARVRSAANPAAPDGFLDALLAPLAVDGSVVLVAHPDPDADQRRVAEEKVTQLL